MDGSSFAKDGESAAFPRTDLSEPAADPTLTGADAQHAAHPAWVKDHEAIYTWLRSIPESERTAFLARIASNIEAFERSAGRDLEPRSPDTTLAFAILVEYAQHLGISPVDACYVLQQRETLDADPLLGVRVDNMLADAAARRDLPRHRGDDAQPPTRAVRGLTSSGRATPGRRGRSSSEAPAPSSPFRGPDRVRRVEPGRAG
jgi:hypothetical protein